MYTIKVGRWSGYWNSKYEYKRIYYKGKWTLLCIRTVRKHYTGGE